MRPLSQATVRTSHSGIRKMFNMTFGMENIVSFAVGEPDFSAALSIVEAANATNLSGITKYTPNNGLLPLRKKIADSLEQNECFYDPEAEIIVTTGGMEALLMTMLVLIDPGDEVILTDPYWANYPEQIKIVGGVPVTIPVSESNGFLFDPDDVRRAITPKTKMLMINSPSNPTGSVADRTNLEALAEIAREHDLYILTDEVYQKFLYDGQEHVSIASFPGMKERSIIVNSFSKTYAMTGWRIGYAAAPQPLVSEMTKLHEDVTSCVNASAQYGAMAALDLPETELVKIRDLFDRRRKLLIEGLNAIDNISCIIPKGAFYAFPNITGTGMSSEEFAVSLLKEVGVVLIPGTAFGPSGEGFVRLSYATSEENILEGLKRMTDFVNRFCRFT